MTAAEPFEFTKGCPTMKIGTGLPGWSRAWDFGTLLFDTEEDPGQQKPLDDLAIEEKMKAHLVRLMKENDSPAEQFERLGLGLNGT